MCCSEHTGLRNLLGRCDVELAEQMYWGISWSEDFGVPWGRAAGLRDSTPVGIGSEFDSERMAFCSSVSSS